MDLGDFVAEHLEPIITTIVGLVVGGLISLYFFRRSVPEKYIAWQVETDQWLVGANAPPGLAMTYNGTPVRRPRLVTLLVYNAGTVGIRQDDFLSPLRIHVAGSNVISVDVEAVRMIDDRESQVIASTDPDEVLLQPLTMNPGDAMRIRLIVDSGRRDAVDVTAAIFESTAPAAKSGPLSVPTPAALSIVSFVFISALSCFLVVAWLFVPFNGRPTPWWLWLIWGVFLVLFCIPIARLVNGAWKQYNADLLSRRLRHLAPREHGS